MPEGDLIRQLERDLIKYDKIFLVDVVYELTAGFCYSRAIEETSKKVLLLIDDRYKIDFGMISNPNVIYRYISAEDFNRIDLLYHMYEFSDNFCIISGESNYANIFNLIDTGILTYEEAFVAILT